MIFIGFRSIGKVFGSQETKGGEKLQAVGVRTPAAAVRTAKEQNETESKQHLLSGQQALVSGQPLPGTISYTFLRVFRGESSL